MQSSASDSGKISGTERFWVSLQTRPRKKMRRALSSTSFVEVFRSSNTRCATSIFLSKDVGEISKVEIYIIQEVSHLYRGRYRDVTASDADKSVCLTAGFFNDNGAGIEAFSCRRRKLIRVVRCI